MSLNPEYIVTQVKRLVESDKRSEIRLNANGGNSILIVCPPEQEYKFIEVLNASMGSDTYSVIDLNDLLISFIEHSLIHFFNLKEFEITETELRLMAAAAIIGPSKIPYFGYKIPAATGTPSRL